MIFRDNIHQRLFERELLLRHDCPEDRKITALLYLLTGDKGLWNQVQDCVGIRQIDVDKMRPIRLSAPGYLFFAAAKDMATGSRNISLSELADRSLVSAKGFKILCTALTIKGFGLQAVKGQFSW